MYRKIQELVYLSGSLLSAARTGRGRATCIPCNAGIVPLPLDEEPSRVRFLAAAVLEEHSAVLPSAVCNDNPTVFKKTH